LRGPFLGEFARYLEELLTHFAASGVQNFLKLQRCKLRELAVDARADVRRCNCLDDESILRSILQTKGFAKAKLSHHVKGKMVACACKRRLETGIWESRTSRCHVYWLAPAAIIYSRGLWSNFVHKPPQMHQECGLKCLNAIIREALTDDPALVAVHGLID